MRIRNPNGTETELFMAGNNSQRWTEVRAIQKQLQEEGAETFEQSSLFESDCLLPAAPPALSTSTACTADPNRAAQIAELQAAIATSRKFGIETKLHETKLRELQAVPPAGSKTMSYGQAKDEAKQIKAALGKQSRKVVDM